MRTYWITFRIADHGNYQARYDALHLAIHERTDKVWEESSSFILFRSEHTIDQLASAVERALDTDIDVALIGMTEVKSARIVGDWSDPDLTELIPFVQNPS